MNYLTEESLSEFLIKAFPYETFIRNKKVNESGINGRPDFRSITSKIIVEFNGYRHYSQSSVILADETKRNAYAKLCYKVIEIPYFVQLSTYTVKELFDITLNINQTFPHGFISDTAMLPADFCFLGIERFKSDLERLPLIKKDIANSLENKIKELGDERYVLPPSINLKNLSNIIK